MRFSKVLLCVPPLKGSTACQKSRRDLPMFEVPEMPLSGIGYLSEFLLSKGIDVEVMDMRFGYSVSDLLAKIHEFKPDLVGFNMMTYNCFIGYSVISKIRSDKYKIMVGGPHASTLRKDVLKDCPEVDYAIKLEGELTLLELCEGKDEAEIKGLIFRKDGEIVENEDRPFIESLDTLPFPRYKKFELDKYAGKSIPISTSRGCPYDCIYCPIQAAIGKRYRARSAEDVVNEIKFWYGQGRREFIILDDNMTLLTERVYKICDLIEKNDMKGLSLNCSNGVRADRVDFDLLKRMKEVGFDRLSFGVESANDKILKTIKKGESKEVIEKAIKNACDLGYDVGLFFIVGLPGETNETIRESFEFAKKYPVNFARFYNPIVFPRTELFEWAKKNNLLTKDYDKKIKTSAHQEND